MPNRTSTIESRTAFSTGSKLLACIGLMLALFACAFFAQPQQAFAAYPAASEVYVSGKQVSEIPSSAATYDASTGTLTLYKQANGVSVKSTRTNLDLNIVVEGNVTVYARSKHDYLLPNLYGISNDTGGNISINVTENSKLSVNVVIADDAAPPEVSITEFGGIWCKGRVTLTGEEGSNFSVYARSDWYKVTGGKSELQSLPNLPTTGIRANGGLYINGALSGKIQVQNHGATSTLNYCTSAVRVASGAQVSVGGTGDWTFDTSSCWYKGDNADQFNALFYVNMGSIRPNIADSVGKVKFSKTNRENSYFALAGTGTATPTWSMAFSDLPEINYHVLTVGAQNAEYAKDSRAIINSTTIKLTELPALGTPATLTSDNTELDVGQSQPRYTVNYGEGHWWYKRPGKDYWITLGNTEDIPADATAVRVSFVLEANEGYRVSYGTSVRVQLPDGTTRNTTERNYMHPASNPSKGSFYIDLQLSDIAEQHPIERVEMWGLSSPYMGREAWTESGTTNTTSSSAWISGSHYTRYEWATGDQLTSNGYQYNQYWTEVIDADVNGRIQELDTGQRPTTFEAGKKYCWHGVLHAKTGWKFTSDTLRDLDGGIAAPKKISSDGKVMEVTKIFQCPTQAINKVEAIDQTEPVAGQTAAIDATVPDNANYSIDTGRSHWVEGVLNASTYWTDADTPFTGTFEANKFYTLVMFIEPDRANGCGFPFTSDNQLIWDKKNATINGAGYEYGYYFAEGTNDGRGSLMVFRVFWCNDPDAITHINIQQTMPVAGQVAVSDAVSLTPDVTLDAVGAEQVEFFTSLDSNFDVSRISDDATSVWIGNLFNEDESFNYAALMPTFEYSEAGIDRTYTFNARAIAADGKTFARDEASATVKVFVGGVPASVQVTSDDPDVAKIRLPYTMPWANSNDLKLFVPSNVVLQRENASGGWDMWVPTEEDYNDTGFDYYSTAAEGMHFRVYPSSKWQPPAGEEFYKWYSSTGDVDFGDREREKYTYFTMPDHDVTIDILTQAEGTLPTELNTVTVSGYTASEGWEDPDGQSYTQYNGYDQWREAVLVDTKGDSDPSNDYTLKKGTDYTVSYEPAMSPDVGNYIVTYTGIPGEGNAGGYEGALAKGYQIYSRAIEDCDITLDTTYAEDPANPGDDPIWWEYYTGEEIKPAVTVKLGDVTLTEGTDYELKYYWNVDVGTATVEIYGKGNMHSWITRNFEIRGRDINDATIAAIPDEIYDGYAHEPKLTVTYAGSTLEEGTDYSVYYSDNRDAGTATVTIEGRKNAGWAGTRDVTFAIKPLDLDDESITWHDVGWQGYTGSEIKPGGSYGYLSGGIALENGSNVQYEYSNNVYPGQGTITVKPKSGNFTGSHELNFDIDANLYGAYMDYSGVEDSYPYTGSQIKPEPVVKIGDHPLVKDVDYELEYGENVNVGGSVGWVNVVPCDSHYYNSYTIYFDITPASIGTATIVPIADQSYADGDAVEPSVTVKMGDKTLEPGTDYVLTYENNREIGEATVIVHGVGNYGGQASVTFNIVEPEPLRLLYAAGVEGSTKWQDWVADGEMAGTAGKSLRMEGLMMKLDGPMPKGCSNGGIRYQAQLQSDGWQTWKEDGQVAGYDPKKSGGKRLEAVKIELTGDLANHYDVWYHLQVQRFGWMDWVKNGDVSGTVGYAFRVEAVEAVLLPKGSGAPTIGHDVATSESNMLSYVRCRSYDNKVWQGAKGEGDVSGTRKQTKTCIRVGLAASSFSAAGIEKGDSYIQVRVYQGGKWSKWSTADDAEVGAKNGKAITGVQAKLYPGSTLTSDYDLYYRVEVKDGSGKACWLGWAKEGETAGQSNLNLEQLEFSLVPKGDPAPPANADELQDTIAHVKQRWVIERWPCNWPKPAYRF